MTLPAASISSLACVENTMSGFSPAFSAPPIPTASAAIHSAFLAFLTFSLRDPSESRLRAAA